MLTLTFHQTRFWMNSLRWGLMGGVLLWNAAALALASSVAEDEVTIAQPLELQAWLSDSTALRDELLGKWTSDSSQILEIYPLPIAGNTVLVSLRERIVPGFLTEVEGARFLVIGDMASEALELMPRVFQVSDANASRVYLVEVIQDTPRSALGDPEALGRWLVQRPENDSGIAFHRQS